MLKSDLQIQGDTLTERNRKPTEKESIYSQQVLFNKSKRMLTRLKGISVIIRNSAESGFHLRILSEEFSRYHDLIKLLLDIHKKYHSRLNDKQQELDHHWSKNLTIIGLTR